MADEKQDDRPTGRERFKQLPRPIPPERLVADRGTDTHEEWDDAFREMTWFVKFVG